MGERGHDCEETTLLAQLNHHRERAIAILDGLSEEDLRRPVLPSGWSCLGMIADLATLERFWFRAVVAGEPNAADAPDDEPGDWRIENLRGMVLRAITESAGYTGHLDAARELIDGRQWLVLEG